MSLRYRLLTLVLGIPLLLLLIHNGYLFLQDQQQRRDTLRSHLSESVELLMPSLTRVLDDNDSGQLQPLLQRLLDLRGVSATIVRASDGDVVMHLGTTQTSLALPERRRTQVIEEDGQWRLFKPLPTPPLSWARRDETSTYYWLEVVVSESDLALTNYRQLVHYALAWLAMATLLLLAAYAIQRRVLPNLRRQRQALQRLDDGDYHYRLQDTGPRELASLSRAINRLGEHLLRMKETQRQQLEQTTSELQESMETIEVQNIELDMARRRAQQANRIKSEFLANMSHEIRTPLNGIIGFCRLLGRGRLDVREREWLGHIETASNNLLTLINGILDFSKMEAGKLELDTVAFDMVTLVDEVLTLQAPASQEKDLQLLGLVFDDVPSELLGDPQRIKQVLGNLVNNAIKFTDQGEVIVRVLVDEIEGNIITLRLRVSDTGIGLPASIREQLFQPFSQGSVSRSREYGGSGLGLMICKQLVEQMGGEISAVGRPEGGSEFSFTLSLRSLVSATERPPELMLASPLIGLWEPHATTRQALGHQLLRWGARVRVLQNDAEFDDSLDMLIIGITRDDLQSQRLQAWQQRLAILNCPVLVLINSDPYDLADLSFPLEGEVLCKPVPRTRLCEVIERMLSKSVDTLAPAREPDASDRHITASARVLVVDDIASNLLLVKELLHQAGVTVLLAASGQEALALAHDQEVDLVLMDIRMPGMSGVEVMQALRRLGGRWGACPFVALTAHAEKEETHWLHDVGMQEVLTKPLDEQALARILTRYLGITPNFDTPHSDAAPGETEDGDEQGPLAVVDMQLGQRLAGGRLDLAQQTLEMLLDGLDQSEAELRESFEASDEKAFLDAVHRLNGACRYCGVPELALLCETLETRVRAQGLPAVGNMLDAVFAAMQRLREWKAQQICT
ncbi:ATP-binding protein [Halomonas sp. GXIMD04776]|uniref:HAMP domain-containing sensor histidine kinase n=1 Tax=Halomonas sp. GXIMD04776 TaxID=3415605 RepID=UPI003CA2E114